MKILKLGVVLAIFGSISAGLIAYVNELTEPIIEERLEQEKYDSFSQLVSDAEFDEGFGNTVEFSHPIKNIISASRNGEIVAYIYNVIPKGFEGEVELLFAIDIESEQLLGMVVLNQAETPGLGARIIEEEFYTQFSGKSIAEEEMDFITGATITSKAVKTGRDAAIAHFNTIK